ncbi:MAG: low molecular weight phosphotyrosine protein phosphatase [Rhodospirillales bacterium]|nr:low molecular weight phosphotyrosine protein phosphatase [Rhodospirillales bacterium]
MVNVLFVCLGNICRSPAAEGIFRAMVAEAGLTDRISADSAGTHDYQVGRPPDRRAQTAARRRGIDLSALRARQVDSGDFLTSDLILAMDRNNLRDLEAMCPLSQRHRLGLFLDHAPSAGRRDVPDPYYGGDDGFEDMLDLVTLGARGLVAELRRELPLAGRAS